MAVLKLNRDLTLLQLAPWNSLATIAFCPYINGEDQNPHIHHFFTFSDSKQGKESNKLGKNVKKILG